MMTNVQPQTHPKALNPVLETSTRVVKAFSRLHPTKRNGEFTCQHREGDYK